MLTSASKFQVWQEVFDEGASLLGDATVDVWKNFGLGWRKELEIVSQIMIMPIVSLVSGMHHLRLLGPAKVTGQGHPAILSAPWFLNYIDYGSDWVEMYKVEPLDFPASSEDPKSLVIGGKVTSQ